METFKKGKSSQSYDKNYQTNVIHKEAITF